MGALYAGTCFDSAASAARAYFSAVPPASVPGAPSYLSFVSETEPGVWSVSILEDGAFLRAVVLDSPVFPACSPLDSLLDGMALGWLVVGVLASAWLIGMLRKAWS